MNALLKLLRPARLTRRFPEANGITRIMSCDYDSEAQLGPSGLAGLQARMPALGRWINGPRMELPTEERAQWVGQVHDAIDEIARVSCIRAYGTQVFVIASDVTSELAKTSIGEICMADIRLPFPGFYIQFEQPITLPDSREVLEGAYVRGGSKRIAISLCTIDPEEARPWWAMDRTYAVELDCGDPQQLLQQAVDLQVAKNRENAARLRSDLEAASQALQPSVPFTLDVMRSTAEEKQAEILASNSSAVECALEVVVNAICLLTVLPDAMVKEGSVWPRPVQTRPGSSHKTEKGALPVRFISFGSSMPGERSEGEGISPRAHWRRGHWRRTPYGPISDRAYRPKWIRPTLVNPDHGPAAEASIYRVSE